MCECVYMLFNALNLEPVCVCKLRAFCRLGFSRSSCSFAEDALCGAAGSHCRTERTHKNTQMYVCTDVPFLTFDTDMDPAATKRSPFHW